MTSNVVQKMARAAHEVAFSITWFIIERRKPMLSTPTVQGGIYLGEYGHRVASVMPLCRAHIQQVRDYLLPVDVENFHCQGIQLLHTCII